jgi:hypothetical protein
MLRPLTRSLILLAAAALATPAAVFAKPCNGATPVPTLESMLPGARVALGLPGTDQVAVDAAARCIGIQVRSKGTARLVKLVLRGMKVPREVADIRVVEPSLPAGAIQPAPQERGSSQTP